MDIKNIKSLIDDDYLERALCEIRALPEKDRFTTINDIKTTEQVNDNVERFGLLDWLVCMDAGEVCGDACNESACCGSGSGACCFCGICLMFSCTKGECCNPCIDSCCGGGGICL